ncbi:MAG: hypothetical protein SF029_08840 [bacterium]|nr:hypothetical protein [bacterium]
MQEVSTLHPTRRGQPSPFERWLRRRLRRRLYMMMPYAGVTPDNPVFAYDARRLPTNEALQAQMMRWGMGTAAAVIALWTIAALALVMARSLGFGAWESVYELLVLGMGVGFLDKLVLDFIAVLSSVNLISDDFRQGRWDLLALSNVSMRQVVEARFAVAQVRTWRTVAAVSGFRFGVWLALLLHVLVLPLFLPSRMGVPNPLGTLAENWTEAFVLLTFVFCYGLFGWVIVLEPRWRMRALAMGGLAVSTLNSGSGGSLFSAFGVVLGVWVVQIVVAVFSGCALFFGGFSFLGPDVWWMIGIGFSIFFLGMGVVIYGAYDNLTTMWRDNALRRLIRLGGAL